MPLAFGLALSIILIGKVYFDLSYDTYFKDADRIYIIKTGYNQNGDKNNFNQVSGAVAPGFKDYVPGVEEATRTTLLVNSNKYLTEDGNTIVADNNFVVADTNFFKVFDREIITGKPEEILNSKGDVMVSRSFAEKLGGVEKAIGQIVKNYSIPQLQLTVSGIFEDFPENGTLHVDILFPMSMMSKASTGNWIGNDRYKGYVKLHKGVNPSDLAESIRLMQEKYQPLEEMEKNGIKLWYYLSPFYKLHTSNVSVRNAILLLSIITVLLMAISMLNYLLSVISMVVVRSKSFATRKCFGAQEKNIYAMLAKEAAFTIVSAFAIAVTLLLVSNNFVRDILGISIAGLLMPATYVIIAVVVCILFAFAALLPGYIYSKIPVTAALRRYSDSKRRWKYVLLLLQFAINVFLFGMLMVMTNQYNHVLGSYAGYDYDNLLYVSAGGNNPEKIELGADVISSVQGVKSVHRCSTLPFSVSSGNNIYLPDSNKELFNVADQYFGTEGFFETLGIEIIEGREPLSAKEVAVSRTFVEKMAEFAEWEDGAVGKQIIVTEHSQGTGSNEAFTISGVYEDYLIGTFNNPETRPSIRFYSPAKGGSAYYPLDKIIIKVEKITPALLSEIKGKLKETFDNGMEVEVRSYKERMEGFYHENKKMRDTFLAGSLFALIISIFGLIGYISNECSRRSKEVAVRKINGATSLDIVRMFTTETLKMAAIAMVIGDIFFYMVAARYLQQFPERISLHAVYFIAADVLLVLIVVVTVAINSMRIALSNPVDSIKNE